MRWWQIRRRDADLERELRADLELEEEEQRERGAPVEEAPYAARRAFGNMALIKEQTHEAWGWAPIERFWQDLRYALRSVLRATLLSALAILALSLGIGLNTGVFTMLNAMYLQPPTREDPASYVQVYPRYAGWFAGAGEYSSFTTGDFDAIRTRSRALEEVSGSQQYSALLNRGDRRIPTLLVTCSYFHVLGIQRPLMGRFFAPGECNLGSGAQVAVLSEPFWRSQFSADPHIVGKTIHLSGVPVVVIGVVPTNAAKILLGSLFVPYTLQPLLNRGKNLLASPDTPWLSIAGRLRPGFSKADAWAELSTIMSQQDRSYVERQVSTFNRKTSLVLTGGAFVDNPATHNIVVGLMALVLGPLALIFLLACSNVTMLFLSRSVVRRGEIAVRLALGTGRAQLARMFLIESLIIVVVGAVLSVIVAYRTPVLIMNAVNPGRTNFAVLLHPDWRVFVYLAILAVAATTICALMPIRAAWKLDLLSALKGHESAATVRSRTMSSLIIVQIALSFVLICAAVMFGRLPGLIEGMNPGFEIHQTLAVPLGVDTSSHGRANARVFYRRLESRILAVPGVQSLAHASLHPFDEVPPDEVRLPGQAKGKGRPTSIDNVSDGFFSTFGIQALRGRLFLPADADSTSAVSVAVVSRAFAKEFWPGADPLGKTVVTPEDRSLTVVGVVADTRSERFGVVDGPRLYTLREPSALGGPLYVRFTGSEKSVENAIRDIVKNLDPTQIVAPETISESLEAEAEQLTSLAHITLVMASIALLMAVTGVYGVLSFAVNHRVREVGIKMVLGANRVAIFRSVILQAIRNLAIGLVCGVALVEPAAWLAARIFARSPLPLRDFDVTVLGLSAVLLAIASLVAMCLPAFRATRVDPIRALRAE